MSHPNPKLNDLWAYERECEFIRQFYIVPPPPLPKTLGTKKDALVQRQAHSSPIRQRPIPIQLSRLHPQHLSPI